MSLELIELVTENSASGTAVYPATPTVSVNYSASSDPWKVLCIGVVASSSTNFNTINVTHDSILGTKVKLESGDVWEDNGAMIWSKVYYILHEDLPTWGSKGVHATITAGVADVSIAVALFRNVDQGAPKLSASRVVTNGSSENTIGFDTGPRDMLFTVGAGQEGSYGWGDGQVSILDYNTGGIYHRASYELQPPDLSDVQALDIKGDSSMSSMLFTKLGGSSPARAFIIG